MIISNPPYATFSVRDRFNPDLNDLKIHHAFLARSIRLLKDNGLCIMVVPSYCLDNSTLHAREKIAEIANLEFACRLPDSLFLDAKVTVDIVAFRKVAKPSNTGWKNLTKIELDCGYKDYLNNYYIENPGHILGSIEKHETYLSKEKRTRQGLKVTGAMSNVNSCLPDLIVKLAPSPEKQAVRAETSAVIDFSKKVQANALTTENNIVSLHGRLEAVALELSDLINELKKVA